MSSAKQIPVIEGLFTWSDDGANLIGTRCVSCGNYYFPKSISCRNPNCNEKKIEEVPLSRRGKLYTYTIQYYEPPPPFKMEPFSPYAIGLVELPEGVRIIGQLTGCEFEDIKMGMEVETVVEGLYRDEQGNEVVTWKFKPVS